MAFVAIELSKALIAPGAGRTPPFTGPHTPESIVTNLLMLHSLHLHSQLTWNAPSWTVSVEFYTYLVFAALVISWPRRPILTAAIMAVVGAVGVMFVARSLSATFDFGLFRCFYGFFVGVLTWKVWRAAPMPPLGPRLATLVEAAMTIGVFVYIALIGGPPFGYAGPLVFALFIWIYASEQGQVTRLFSARPLVWLGEISYSIYLVHFLIIVMIGLALRSLEKVAHLNYATVGLAGLDDGWFIRLKSLWAMDPFVALYLVVVIAAASQTYRFIEQPGRALIKPRRRAPAKPEASGQPVTS